MSYTHAVSRSRYCRLHPAALTDDEQNLNKSPFIRASCNKGTEKNIRIQKFLHIFEFDMQEFV